MFASLLRKMGRQSRQVSRVRARLQVEVLEGRAVPSTLVTDIVPRIESHLGGHGGLVSVTSGPAGGIEWKTDLGGRHDGLVNVAGSGSGGIEWVTDLASPGVLDHGISINRGGEEMPAG